MVIKITPKQSKRINALIRKLCCNYVDGNCLLLDDGEEHSCVQCISRYGIYCNYFKNAVLPADNALHAEIMRPAGRKQCQICKTYFIPKANNIRSFPTRRRQSLTRMCSMLTCHPSRNWCRSSGGAPTT